MNLTPRQLEVASLISQAFVNKHIADVLGVSEEAIDSHIWRISNRWKANRQRNIRVQIARKYWELYG